MALGGGTFLVNDKVLPGTYVNVVSKSSAVSSSSVSGVVAMPLVLDWGIENEIFTVTNEDFFNNSIKIFGYSYDHEKMTCLRDLFKNAKTLHAYRLGSSHIKASSTYATARYSGKRGNAVKLSVSVNINNTSLKDVYVYLDNILVDKQTVTDASKLIDNEFVVFNKESSLADTAGTALTGGGNGIVDANEYIKFLNLIEAYSFNILTANTENAGINSLIVSFTKRMRDEYGVKFQSLVYNTSANYEGAISFNNAVSHANFSPSALCYWLSGALAACSVNSSVLNKRYDGEFDFSYEAAASELKKNIENGFLVLHRTGNKFAILADINTLTETDASKGDDFKNNQTIRILDYLSNSVASIFNNIYLGNVPNNEAGRISLWSDVVAVHKNLLNLGALESFVPDSVKVEKGADKGSVVITSTVMPVNAMSKLYATIIIV